VGYLKINRPWQQVTPVDGPVVYMADRLQSPEDNVLKGGVLLAAFGNRRPTRDVDLSAIDLRNDAATVLDLVSSVLTISLPEDDGLTYHADSASAEVIREEDYYSGVRASATATLASARLTFHVHLSVGDPIYPEPTTVAVPRLHAEKIVTAVQRGTANTRWRDFGDIWTLSRHHLTTGAELQDAFGTVANTPVPLKVSKRSQPLSQRCHNWVRTRGVVGGREDTVIAGQAASRLIMRQRNSADVRLGVKWSQVQILSARPEK
jgi:hypothetical protein